MLDRSSYELEVEDLFQGPQLDERLWVPHYLPHWSSRHASTARFNVGGERLQLRIDENQPPWCPEFNGELRVSSLQTGVFAGPLGSEFGQHRFRPGLRVREEQPRSALYTPQHGLFELRCRALDDPACMVALWMIGYEDHPARSAEICICEIFGRDVSPRSVRVGMGVHPFGDPSIRDEFAAETVHVDALALHTYSAEWTPSGVAFYVDERLVKVVPQSPAYPMQFMLNIYEFRDGPTPPSPPDRYPKVFRVDSFRGYRPARQSWAREPAFP